MVMLLSRSTELVQSLVHGNFAAGDLFQHVEIGGRGFKIAVQGSSNGMQTVLYRGIADVENVFHFLDGAVMANKRDHQTLIFGGKLCERRELKLAFDVHRAVRARKASQLEGLRAGRTPCLRN